MSMADKNIQYRTASSLVGIFRFVIASWAAGLKGAWEFRASFVSQVLTMMVNDAVWIVFWGIFFTKFPLVNGWGFKDILLMWAIATTGIGLSMGLFANLNQIPRKIVQGELDVFLTVPKPVLLQLLVSGFNVSAWGDFLFGLLIYGIYGEHTLYGMLRYGLGTLIAFTIFTCYMILVGSIAFFIGNAESLNGQLFNALITFMTYPTDIFKGWSRILLFTAIPAGFVSYLPIGLIRAVNVPFLIHCFYAVLALAVLSMAVFHAGLRRYSSGNLLSMRM